MTHDRMAAIEARLAAMEARLAALEAEHGRLSSGVTTFCGTADSFEAPTSYGRNSPYAGTWGS